MTDTDWKSGSARSLALLIDDPDSEDPAQSFYLVLNAAEEAMTFVLPVGHWDIVLGSGSNSLSSREVAAEGFTVTVLQGR